MTGRAFLGRGSNRGDRRRHLADAIASLGPAVVQVSPIYETEPLGGPPQQDYLNAVVELATELTPRELLGVCHRLEAAAGRVRGERWGPRTLDVDVLLYGDEAIDDPDLQIPHPRMWARRFVVAPLFDIAPELVPDGWERRVDGNVRPAGTL
jgi:2-amino-4-hydroxy-6-hydroxymethyldihydropteridine diphosphokinase